LSCIAQHGYGIMTDVQRISSGRVRANATVAATRLGLAGGTA
jgi:hypothetical protein